jgi:hypothetical protein
MLARLGDHLLTLDGLRDSHKHASLDALGLTESAPNSENVAALLSSHAERYDVHMANYLRYAHVALTYMIFEDRLQAFGGIVASARRGAAFVAKSNRGLMPQFEQYLTSLKLPIPRSSGIDALRQLRNCIVHARGRIGGSKNASQLQSLVGSLEGVSIDATGRLSFTTEGCLLLQEEVIHYLHSIDSAAGFRMWIPDAVRANFQRNMRPHLDGDRR